MGESLSPPFQHGFHLRFRYRARGILKVIDNVVEEDMIVEIAVNLLPAALCQRNPKLYK